MRGSCRGRQVFTATISTSSREAPIRTLSVSLVAVAAIAASLLLTRSRVQSELADPPHGEDQPARIKLDAIRAAGL
jgi:hypothetical protein